MKIKLFLIDKISIILSIYNTVSYLLAILIPNVTHESAVYSFASLNFFNVVFVTPFIILAMLVANLIAAIKKTRNNQNKIVNIVLIAVFVLMIPVWQHFFGMALLSV